MQQRCDTADSRAGAWGQAGATDVVRHHGRELRKGTNWAANSAAALLSAGGVGCRPAALAQAMALAPQATHRRIQASQPSSPPPYPGWQPHNLSSLAVRAVGCVVMVPQSGMNPVAAWQRVWLHETASPLAAGSGPAAGSARSTLTGHSAPPHLCSTWAALCTGAR